MQTPAEEKDHGLSGRYVALLEVAPAIASHRTLEGLFTDLAHRLHPIIEFNYLSVLLYDSARDVMRVDILDSHGPDTVRPRMEFSMDESLSAWVWHNQQPQVLEDLDRETRRTTAVSASLTPPQVSASSKPIQQDHAGSKACTLRIDPGRLMSQLLDIFNIGARINSGITVCAALTAQLQHT